MSKNAYKKLIKRSKAKYDVALRMSATSNKKKSRKLKKLRCALSGISENYFLTAEEIIKNSKWPGSYFIAIWYFLNSLFWFYVLTHKTSPLTLNVRQLFYCAAILNKFKMHKKVKEYIILAILNPNISDNEKATMSADLLRNPALNAEEKSHYYLLAKHLVNEGKVTLTAKMKILQNLAIYSKKEGFCEDSNNHIKHAIAIAKKYGFTEHIKTIRTTLEKTS